LITVLAFLAFAEISVRAEGDLNLVIAIDLTCSVSAVGSDGKSGFQKNV